MATKVIMPQMGESIFEGTITKWLKKPGDRVARDEPLFEISTDKVDSEIPAPASGVLTQILVPEGQTVQINTVVAVIDGELSQPAIPAEAAAQPKPERAIEPKPPATEKPAQEVRPPVEEKPAPPVPQQQEVRPAPSPAKAERDTRTSPLVRRLAREHNIDLSRLQGTGLGGRITKQDILSYIDQKKEAPAAPAPAVTSTPKPYGEQRADVAQASQVSGPATPVEAPQYAESETVPMTPMRKAIAEHMVLSKRTSAHVNTVFEVDMTSIVHLREKQKSAFEAREGIKLTYTPFFVKALVDAVRDFPILNCSVSGDNIIYKRRINVGVAVALETGLIVPVVKDAHLKSFTGLALAIHDVAERARAKRLRPDEVQNGTITITNPGIYGSLFGTPIINQPQVAILGVGGIQKRPVVINDAIAIRSMVYLSLTFDHRVIDGAVADQFMANLQARLQSWNQWIE
jgi:2-oxoglutarate dehydrogenase E2 component (dihydrolipoamide succinyltransferase)